VHTGGSQSYAEAVAAALICATASRHTPEFHDEKWLASSANHDNALEKLNAEATAPYAA